ncbi:MAG TPA: phosphatidylglycerophosphatase A [bacterium]|nr:phosphatidylglycerophosphatase A [bacterium]
MKNIFVRSFVSVLGLGYIPVAPGTFGTLGGFLFWYFYARHMSQFSLLMLTLVLIILSCYISSLAEKVYNEKDSQKIVIDEFCGYLVSILFVGKQLYMGLLGFALFRLFDIFKPWPVRNFERLPKGIGVVMDDVMAGLYAGIILWIISILLGG